MKLIIGLGNPGKEYSNTRHNIGFLFLDHLNPEGDWISDKKFQAETSKILLEGKEYLLVKPQTFMNLSGKSINQILQYYKIPLTDIICVYDDIDLPFGSIRIRHEGSAGTHNGMKSMIQELGSDKFHRLRIGIENRNDQEKRQIDLSSYVLGRFTEEETKELAKIFREAQDSLDQKGLFT